jgi:hypothetical protein
LQDFPALVAGAYATIHFSHPQGSRSRRPRSILLMLRKRLLPRPSLLVG